MMGYEDGMFFGGGFMWLFWIVLIFIVVMLVKQFSTTAPQPKEHDALEILKRRYANGEIDEAEYQKRKETLEE